MGTTRKKEDTEATPCSSSKKAPQRQRLPIVLLQDPYSLLQTSKGSKADGKQESTHGEEYVLTKAFHNTKVRKNFPAEVKRQCWKRGSSPGSHAEGDLVF